MTLKSIKKYLVSLWNGEKERKLYAPLVQVNFTGMKKKKNINQDIEKIEHCLREVKDMHDLIEDEIKEIESIVIGKGNTKILTTDQIKKTFGDFKYSELKDGRIKIEDGWEYDNIISIAIEDIFMRCNSKVSYQIIGAISDVIRYGYKKHFKWTKGSGCFVPRHKMWDINRNLSGHAFGIDIDIDPINIPYGKDIKHHPEVVKIFERWGFKNGQDWKVPDPHHFSWVRFV